MLINFDDIPEQDLHEFKGGTGTFFARMAPDEKGNNIILGRLEPGSGLGLHTHTGNCEIIYVIKGTGTVEYDGQTFEIHAGQCHYCPEGHEHRFMNKSNEPVEIFAVIPIQP